jgi:hypothetical protein
MMKTKKGKNMKINISIILSLFWMCLSIVPAQADGFKEGKWTLNMVTHMSNMTPEMAKAMQQMQNLPPQVQAMMKARGVEMSGNGQDMIVTVTRCLTKQNPIPHFTKRTDIENYCQQTHVMTGNTVTFNMTCNHNDFQMNSSGTMSYTGDTMQGSITSHESNAGHSMDSAISLTGQYMGACDK